MMRTTIAQFWQQRNHTERRTIAIGGTVLAIALLYAFIWQPMTQEQQYLRQALPQMRAAAAQMHMQATEVDRLRSLPQKNFNNSLSGALEYAAARSSVGAPSQLTPLNDGRTRIAFNATAFDSWIEWIRVLQAEQGLRVESVEISALAEPGMVKTQTVLSLPSKRP